MKRQHFVDLTAEGGPQLGRGSMLFSPLAEPKERLQAREHCCKNTDEAEPDPQAYVHVALKRREHTRADERREYDDRDSEPDVRASEPGRERVVLGGGRRGPRPPVLQQLEHRRRPRRGKLSAPSRGFRTGLRRAFHGVPSQESRSDAHLSIAASRCMLSSGFARSAMPSVRIPRLNLSGRLDLPRTNGG